MHKLMGLSLFAVFGLLLVESTAPAAATKPVIVLATLLVNDSDTAIGSANYQSVTKKGTTKTALEVAVSKLELADGTQLNVFINGSQVGTMTVRVRRGVGRAALALASAAGATVPNVIAGSSITVELTDTTVVAAGTFVTIR